MLCPLASLVGRLRTSVWRSAFFVLALTLGSSDAAIATPLQAGDLFTYSQGDWGGNPSPFNAAGLLQANYATVYASTSGLLEVGIPGPAGFSLVWTNVADLLHFLPAVGTSGALNSDLLDPSASAAGAFGGNVTALRINIDFSDAGLLQGTLGINFGDLTLSNFTTLPLLNGLTVRQFQSVVNTLLGGGSSIYTIADLDLTIDNLNSSFGGGALTIFAQDHLLAPTDVTSVPEPSSGLLVGLGGLGLAWTRRLGRRC